VFSTGESGSQCDGYGGEDDQYRARDEPSAAHDLAISRAWCATRLRVDARMLA
jgi:hypothetical protein